MRLLETVRTLRLPRCEDLAGSEEQNVVTRYEIGEDIRPERFVLFFPIGHSCDSEPASGRHCAISVAFFWPIVPP